MNFPAGAAEDAIARVLASEAEFIVCDEPTSRLSLVQHRSSIWMRDLPGQVRPHLSLHQPQPRSGPAYGEPHRRDVSRRIVESRRA